MVRLEAVQARSVVGLKVRVCFQARAQVQTRWKM